MRRRAFAAVVAAVSIALAAGCSSGSGGTPSAAPATSVGSTAPSTSPPAASPPLVAPSLSAADVADNGLPSKVGAGKLSTPTIKRLIQFFEDKVAHAYAYGDADALDHYLAGPMLTGNRATIALLSQKSKRNVFRIKVKSVKPQTNEAHHVIAEMTGDMVLDYFFNPKTRKILDHGLPGPSQVQFVIFLDQNPKTHTWYWTGEQSEGADSDSGTVDGAQTQ